MGRLLTRLGCEEVQPNSFPYLALWLDAKDHTTLTFNGGSISQWDDKSGHDNHAIQNTGTSQPPYVENGLNSFPALDFGASQLMIVFDHSSLDYSTMSFFMVAQRQSDTGGAQALMNRYGTSREFQLLVLPDDHYELQASQNGAATTHTATSTQSADIGKAAILSCHFDGSELSLSVNGEAAVSTAMPAIFAGNANLTVGRAPMANFMGRISEVIFYTETLSPPKQAALVHYLAKKWGVTLL